MKCDECLNLLEAYVECEASRREADILRAHVEVCAACANAFEALTAENEMYARYDRDLRISPALWNGIAARIAAEPIHGNLNDKRRLSEWLTGLLAVPAFRFALPAMAALAIAVVIGFAYWRTRPAPNPEAIAKNNTVLPKPITTESPVDSKQPIEAQQPIDSQQLATKPTVVKREQDSMVAVTTSGPSSTKQRAKESDVLFTEAAYSDEDRDTASHLEQAQNLLVSFRNIAVSDTDQEIDVSYEKAESRRLLNENVVMRRDAEVSGKFPMKSVLGSLEPYLIDIANLPDKAAPQDVRQVQDRVQRREIVAELRGYK